MLVVAPTVQEQNMCIFSKPAEVTGTNIFARSSEYGRQYLVYSMKVKASADLAMILPLPVPADAPEDAIRWISLKGYARFFIDLQDIFVGRPLSIGGSGGRNGPSLRVVRVGDFEASFVPSLADFDCLDTRFKLPREVWNHLPQYRDYGFAVFKLHAEATGYRKIHPMAFEFPRADPSRLFFPTIHIHDGEVHPSAHFDHVFYCQQAPEEEFPMADWHASWEPIGEYMKISKCAGIIASDRIGYRRELEGLHKNEDLWLGPGKVQV